MRPAFFRTFGVVILMISLPALAILVTLVVFPVLIFIFADPPIEMPNLTREYRMLIFFGFSTVIGLGLLRLRKWAAIYFSVPLFCYGFWFTLTSIEPIRFPWNLLYMFEGISLMLPFVVTIRVWRQLSWRGRWWFF